MLVPPAEAPKHVTAADCSAQVQPVCRSVNKGMQRIDAPLLRRHLKQKQAPKFMFVGDTQDLPARTATDLAP